MPAQRSNEDQAVRISKSIFVTNFPDNLGSKELWKVCEGFIRVNDLDRLVGNLCTIWIGRFHLHANVARFERANKPVKPSGPSQSNAHGIPLHVWSRETFAKIGNKWGEALDIEDNFGSSFARKRLCILTKQPESILEKFKVIFKGKVFVARAKELFTWNPSFLEPKESVYTSDDESKHGARILNDGAQNSDVESDDECNVDGVSETVFSDNVDECNVDDHCYVIASTSLSHPPGFTPLKNSVYARANVGEICEMVISVNMPRVDAKVMGPFTGGLGTKTKNGVRWNGEAIIMGDFNDVRTMDERLGSSFNASSARCFDRFIVSSGLVDVTLEGLILLKAYDVGSGGNNHLGILQAFGFGSELVLVDPWLLYLLHGLPYWLMVVPTYRVPFFVCGLETRLWVEVTPSPLSKWKVKSVSPLAAEIGPFLNPHVVVRSGLGTGLVLVFGASSVLASFRRDVRDGAERQQWDDLSSILNSVVLSSSKDRWTCDLSGDGEFKVKVIRNFIDDLFLPSSDVETRWVKFIPIKVNVFSWRARRDRLPTRVNLSRRGVLLDSHLCPLCNAAMEDVQHVFFRCDVARVVLRKICRWWDLDWQEICSFSDWDAWFLSFWLSSRLKSILEGVFYVAWWRIWRLQNQLVFDASPPNRSTIFDDIVSWSFLWCSSRCNRVFS
ncbi:RNA-directed DNA polymerase, eukaryota [Tanacetum coccineum]|uniref:RNA-directed DNA polymerase, eukaryota n=1 Tax=Tanacetum coccineum TaxID=301880 RepID=A0ABQ5GD70_9ASTR